MSVTPALEAHDLVKTFGPFRAVDGVSLSVPAGTITGVLGPNGAGKTTTLRMLLGIIEPDSGTRTLLGSPRPLTRASEVGYLPEERGLYPAMKAFDAIAFMGALRGFPLGRGRAHAREMMADQGLGDLADRQIRTLSKGQAQTVQLLGTLVHEPRLIVLDEPFSGLDALNQGKLEELIHAQAEAGVTVLFSTHVIAHAERLCERVAIFAKGRIRFDGAVSEARDRLPPQVRLETRGPPAPLLPSLPADATVRGRFVQFALPQEGVEPLLRRLVDSEVGVETLSIERPGLHDAFVAIAGEDAAREMGERVG